MSKTEEGIFNFTEYLQNKVVKICRNVDFTIFIQIAPAFLVKFSNSIYYTF